MTNQKVEYIDLYLYTTKFLEYYSIIYKKKTFKSKNEILYLERNVLLKTNKIYNEKIKEFLDNYFKNENGNFYFKSEIIYRSFSAGMHYIIEDVSF